jgi:hypothetical protein
MLHGKQDPDHAGIFADPPTQANGRAMDFSQDRALAQGMAERAAQQYATATNGGGAPTPAQLQRARERLVHGNLMPDGSGAAQSTVVNAIYPGDPAAAATGQPQQRSHDTGRSWGSYFSTEVADPAHSEQNRPAVTTLTLETPQYHDSSAIPAQQQDRLNQLRALAISVEELFLEVQAVPAPGAVPGVVQPAVRP